MYRSVLLWNNNGKPTFKGIILRLYYRCNYTLYAWTRNLWQPDMSSKKKKPCKSGRNWSNLERKHIFILILLRRIKRIVTTSTTNQHAGSVAGACGSGGIMKKMAFVLHDQLISHAFLRQKYWWYFIFRKK